MVWSIQEKTYAVEKYFKYESFVRVQRDFRTHFGYRNVPGKKIIHLWVKKFREYGTIYNLNSKNENRPTHSGRPKSVRIQANIDQVRESVGRSPKKSLRRRSQELGIKMGSLRTILEEDLNLYPYRIQIKQKLTDQDMEKRVQMANWFADQLDESENFLDNVWFSDEAHFCLSGQVNSKNYVFWGSEVPDEVAERPLHSVKCTAWCAISRHGIIGPYWFEDDEEKAVTINSERYIAVLSKFYRALGRMRGVDRDSQWFQQDGATPHTSNASLGWLEQHFPGRIISRRTDNEWAPHSPDMSPPDFYLWGFLKDNVYTDNPNTVAALKREITKKIRAITQEECKRVIDNFSRRVQVCLQRAGRHLEHVM